jgi:hypothetical protein
MKHFAFVTVVSVFVITVFGVRETHGETASPGEMEQVCRNWLSVIVNEKGSWAGAANPLIVGADDIVAEDGTVVARCYHIEPRGFVVVPVLKELPPIKAYSDANDLDIYAPEGLAQLLREVIDRRTKLYVEKFGSMDASQPFGGDVLFGVQNRRGWDLFAASKTQVHEQRASGELEAMADVGPLLLTTWHQGAPFNNFCPPGDGGRCIVGCVATAMAQVMKHHNWPVSGSGSSNYWWNGDYSCGGSTSGQTLSATYSDPYDWANMPNAGYDATPTQQDALAELNYEAAVSVRMNFGACSSGASMSRVPGALRDYFSYNSSIETLYRSSYTASTWFSIIQTEINEGCPMIYGIYSHAIVCDGWRVYASMNQYHMNYGWGGGNTAWYTVDNLYCPWAGCDVDWESLIRNIIPSCLVQPGNIDFGTVAVGCYRDTTITITNTSTGSISGNISESCTEYDILSGGGPFSLSPGNSHYVTVRFEPLSTATFDCTISTGTTDCSDIFCTGEGGGVCLAEPAFLEFYDIELGDSLDKDIVYYNVGCSSISGAVSESSDHFSIVSGEGSYLLDPQDSLVVTVRFKPTVLGDCNGGITNSGVCNNVACHGYSSPPPPTCVINPDTLAFGSVVPTEFAIKSFDIKNTGYGTVSGDVSNGTCGTNFIVMSGAGAFALGYNEVHSVSILFVPPSEGTFDCVVETGTDDCVDVYCTGIGGAAASCLAQPDTLNFGPVGTSSYRDTTFYLTNTGGGVLAGDVSETSEHYSILSGGGAYSLAAGETLYVTTRFEPGDAGTHTCSIETGSPECSDIYCTGEGDDATGTETPVANRLFLFQNRPNPFNPSTTISFTLPDRMHVRLSVYDPRGRLVRTLVDETLDNGLEERSWDGNDSRGNPVSSGIYFYRLVAGDRVITKKMVLLK